MSFNECRGWLPAGFADRRGAQQSQSQPNPNNPVRVVRPTAITLQMGYRRAVAVGPTKRAELLSLLLGVVVPHRLPHPAESLHSFKVLPPYACIKWKVLPPLNHISASLRPKGLHVKSFSYYIQHRCGQHPSRPLDFQGIH